MGPWGMFGQSHITFAITENVPAVNELHDIHGRVLSHAVSFIREPFWVRNVEPGALPKVFTHFDRTTKELYHIVPAYRCSQCRTLFIVSRVEDLRHACTEKFELKEKTVA